MATRKSTKKATPKEAGRAHISFGVLGENLRSLSIKEGTKLSVLSEKYGLSGLTIKVNGHTTKNMDTVLRNGDEVVAMPQAKNG